MAGNRPASDVVVEANITDVSTESSGFAAATMRGRIHKIFGVLQDDGLSGSATISLKINGTALDGVSLTVEGGAGATFMSDENASPSRGYVNEGDTIEFASDGASTNTAALHCAAIISKM